MAKFALLIGVSEYEQGLNPLPGALFDVKAMQEVLQHPEMGGFADTDITVLENPQRQIMEEAIETLFAVRKKDDLVLLYFSGHGIKDDSGKLYLATNQTRKNPKGELIRTSATAVSLIHGMMENSRSKRQVIILDCCFSGAFAEGMKAKDDESIDLKNQLGGEGRAVLASSTSTQYSFEQQGSDLSVYTRYIVEGITTGAADTDNDGVISVDELHEYAYKKVQEAAPAMKPEIYAVKEGFKINLAKAPIGAPKLEYRKEVEKSVRDGEISRVSRRILQRRQEELGLSDDEALLIENEVLKPYRDYQKNLQEYEQALTEAVEDEGILSQNTSAELKRLQQLLQLTDEDIAPIKEKFTLSQQQEEHPNLNDTTHPTLPTEDDLSSDKDIDYTNLRELLKNQEWEAADYETYILMLKAVKRYPGDWIQDEEWIQFSCTDLRTINNLWLKYSDGHFGFSVHKEIYLSVGGQLDGKTDAEAWEKFGVSVGWRVDDSWIFTTEVVYDTSAPRGHLPGFVLWRVLCGRYTRLYGLSSSLSSLALRLVKCNI